MKYIVATDSGDVVSGESAVYEKKALKIMARISKNSNGWVNPFMVDVETWNKPHKLNKNKIIITK